MSTARITRRGLLAGAAGTAGAAALATVAGAGEASAATVPPPSPYTLKLPHQIEAEALVDNLRLRPWDHLANRYKRAGVFDDVPTSVRWGTAGHPEEFSNLSQCSSFLTLVLQRAYGTAPTVPAGTPMPWGDYSYGWATRDYFQQYFIKDPANPNPYPTAEKYQQAFLDTASLPHFTRVTKPVNLRPGDLVALDYYPDEDNTKPYTGHIVMIRERKGTWSDPVVDAKIGRPVVPYVFEVVDCTSDPHGNPALGGTATDLYRAFPDSRIEEVPGTNGSSTWKEHDGVGYGHMVFYADADTKLFAGYRWSLNTTVPRSVTERPISAGRVWLSDNI
ncbi:hypothetical protein ABTX81_05065 [Kitasatospora sp. NPDC097605]|uniref:hypothetical protein n=1 Tax=Kitasatospora sp. NPDC097605 TaxID=3157226 RepID=UPI00332B7898